MTQRIYIKVVGFSDEERHALNTLFRVSEQGGLNSYQLWTPGSRGTASLALLDGQSYEAQVEAESPANADLRMLWIGDDAPEQVWRSLPRPVQWPDVIQALDAAFDVVDIDFDLDMPEFTSPAPQKQALIVSASREDRLYLRARLALAELTQADEAESGRRAVELARGKQYDFAVVDCGVGDMDAWALLRQLKAGERPIRHVALTKQQRSLREHVKARLAGAERLMENPPHPERLDAWLRGL